MKKRPAPRLGAACLLASLLAALLPATLPAQDAGRILSGTIHSGWADPRPGTGPARPFFLLTDDQGQLHDLALDDALVRQAGGVASLDGRRITVRVSSARNSVASVMGMSPALATAASRNPAGATSRNLSGAPLFDVASPRVRRFAVLLCRFADASTTEPAPRSHYEKYVTGTQFPSVPQYWSEVSDGQYSLAGGAVFGWYTLPRPRADYVTDDAGAANASLLATDCAAAADADVDFSAFDALAFQFNQSLGCCSFASGVTLPHDGATRSFPAIWMADWATAGIGAYAHEIGHTFGLQHTTGPYGDTYDSEWDIMSSSMWWGVGEVNLGAHTLAIQKDRLGLLPASRKVEVTGTDERTVLLERLAQPGANDNALLVTIPVPGEAGTRNYFTVEARRRVGYDAGLPADGVIIHRISDFELTRVVDVDGNGNPNDPGAVFTVGETFLDRETGVSVRVTGAVRDAFRIAVRGTSPQPSLAVAAASRRRTIDFGAGVQRRDSAALTLTAGSQPIVWRVQQFGSRLMLDQSSGTGSAILRWTEQQQGLGAGLHVDTLVIIADGATGSPLRIIDTLEVLPPTSIALGVGAATRVDSIMPGRTLDAGILVQPSGAGSAGIEWTAAATAPWIVIDQGAGAGESSLYWRYDATNLAPGTYVDTITVSSPGVPEPVKFAARLRVLEPPAMTLGISSGSRHVAQSSRAIVDSIPLTLEGADASGLLWLVTTAGSEPRYLQPQFAPVQNIGSGWVRLRREPGSLPPGVYVNEAIVRPTMGGSASARYVDTLIVDPAPSAIALSAASRRDSVVPGSFASTDSIWVQPQGEGGPQRAWVATTARVNQSIFLRRGSMTPGTAVGPFWLVWARNTAGLAAGTHVDTITVQLEDGSAAPAQLIDSLLIASEPAPLTIISDSLRRGATMGADYADTLRVAGGTGVSRWTITSGLLPAGVQLDSTTGVLAGVAEATGSFPFTARVRSGDLELTHGFELRVAAPSLIERDIMDELLGIPRLSASERRYLDLLGNRNGRLDVGDVRAWLRRVP